MFSSFEIDTLSISGSGHEGGNGLFPLDKHCEKSYYLLLIILF